MKKMEQIEVKMLEREMRKRSGCLGSGNNK